MATVSPTCPSLARRRCTHLIGWRSGSGIQTPRSFSDWPAIPAPHLCIATAPTGRCTNSTDAGKPVYDLDARARVYEQSPEVERNMDPDCRGVAVLIDVDNVRGRRQGQTVEMSR